MTRNPHFPPDIRVSVVIPAYGCAATIGYVLEGLFGQTFPPAEIIVVNDCSPDNLEEVLEGYRGRVTVVKNPRNLGLSKTYNAGLRRATTSHVLTLHSDCVLCPAYLETALRVSLSTDDVGAVNGRYQFEDFERMGLPDQLFCILNLLPLSAPKNAPELEEVSFTEGKADLFRRDVLEKYGGFNETLVLTCEDQDLSARMRKDGYRHWQHNGIYFTVKFNATQDSIRKVIRKQFTYARGQGYIFFTHRLKAVRSSTANRNRRVLHRLGQIVTAGLLVVLGLAAFFSTTVFYAWLCVLAARMVYYGILSRPLVFKRRLAVLPAGLTADFAYTIGLLQGFYLTWAGKTKNSV